MRASATATATGTCAATARTAGSTPSRRPGRPATRIREYVESDPRWRQSSRGRLRTAHTVVAPFTVLGDGFSLPDCPRWMIHDRDDLPSLADRIRDTALRSETNRHPPTADDCAVVVEILTGRGVQAGATVEEESDERHERAARLTQEQALILDVTRLLRRVEIRGGAGSGKTVLALAQARQLTTGRQQRPASAWPCCATRSGWPATSSARSPGGAATIGRRSSGTFEELANLWGVESGSRDDPAFWEHRLPELMAERAAELPPGQRFDSFVVDEAQDFADSWWRPIVAALRDDVEGGLYLYSDENQRLFAALRPAPGAARAAGPGPQPAQHPADRRGVPAARPAAHALGAARGRRSSSSRPAPTRRSRRPTTRWRRCSTRAGSRAASPC